MNLNYVASVRTVEPNKHGRAYDILSREADGSPGHIELKAARVSGDGISFVVTDNELRRSRELARYYFYLVFNPDSNHPSVRVMPAEQLAMQALRPMTNRAHLELVETDA